jgi:hypothetical protein
MLSKLQECQAYHFQVYILVSVLTTLKITFHFEYPPVHARGNVPA